MEDEDVAILMEDEDVAILMEDEENFYKIKICEGRCKKTESGDGCCIAKIYSMLKDHSKELKEMEGAKFAETPLHKAAAAGNTEVALEILRVMPSLGRKLDWGGSSPLHLAIDKAHRDTARFMARFDSMSVRVKGKNGMTPLMLCAARARDEEHEERRLLAQLLIACPESVHDVNNLNQTVVHVALVNQGCDTATVLVDWLERRNEITSVLSIKDLNGNTVLHAAAQFGCVRGAEKIVELVKLNRLNSDNKTALDLARLHEQTAVTKILEDKEAKRSNEIYKAPTTTDYVLSGSTYAEKVSRNYYYLTQQLTLDMRNTILVVATLIVAATYQGVLQPPGGVYPADDVETLSMGRRLLGTGTTVPESRLRPILGRKLLGNPESSLRPILGRKGEDTWKKRTAGKMVMKKDKYRYYMPCNTFAFALSMVIVIFVVPGSPVFLILHLCLLFMCISYVLALDAIAFYTCISDTIYAMSLYAIVGGYVVKLLYYPVKALLVDEDWWLRGLGVKFANRCSVTKWFFSDTLVMMKQQHLVLRLS